MLILLAILICLLLLLGVPLFIALGLPVAVFIWLEGLPLVVVVHRLFGGLDRFVLMALPFFIFAAQLMGAGGMSRRLIRLANALIGHLRGGAALATVIACMFFGALSGSSPATVVAVGKLSKPLMDENGFKESFSLGLIMGASSLALLFPPSISMIVYAVVTGVSVGRLFLAGIGPGIVFACVYIIYSYIYARRFNITGGTTSFDAKELFAALKDAFWALGVPVIVIGGIYGGIFTPTEAAAVSAGYGLFVGMVIYRELDLSSALKVAKESALVAAQVQIIIASAAALSWLITIMGVGTYIKVFTDIAGQMPWLVVIAVNLALLFFGMLVDPSSLILVLGPILVPLLLAVGYDPIHIGIIFVANIAIGVFSPPFGLDLFVIKAIFGTPYATMMRSALVMMLISIIALAIIILVPQISLWLPAIAYGR